MLIINVLFDYSHSSGYQVASHGGFDLHFPDSNNAEHLAMCLLVIFNITTQVFCPFLSLVVLLLSYEFLKYILDANPLSDLQIISPFCGLLP